MMQGLQTDAIWSFWFILNETKSRRATADAGITVITVQKKNNSSIAMV